MKFARWFPLVLLLSMSSAYAQDRKPADPSEVNVCGVEQSRYEREGIKTICLRSLPKIEADYHSTILVKPDGSAEILLYPSTGVLTDLTKQKATAIFGLPTTESREGELDVCSYQFAGAAGFDGSELEIYHLDCEFGNNQKLSKYRVRGSSLPKSAWVCLPKK